MKTASGAGIALHAELPTLHLDEPFCYRQAQSRARLRLIRGFQAIERLENSRLLFAGNARAGIADLDPHQISRFNGRDFNLCLLRRELDRVRHEMLQHLF